MIIFLAGLQGIPQIFYEAAEIDGAGRWQRTALRDAADDVADYLFQSGHRLYQFVSGLRQRALDHQRRATAGDRYSSCCISGAPAFSSQKMGYAAVLSWLLFAILMLLSFFVVFRYIGSRVYYENPGD